MMDGGQAGRKGHDYENRLREYSEHLNVNTLFAYDVVDDNRGITSDGRKIYTLTDIYPHADLVTYPSIFEGFGNAFLEAIYHRKPIVVNTYSIYSKDIKPKGFLAIEMEGYVTQAVVDLTKKVLSDPDLRQKAVDRNYEIGNQTFSYATLRRRLNNFMKERPWLF